MWVLTDSVPEFQASFSSVPIAEVEVDDGKIESRGLDRLKSRRCGAAGGHLKTVGGQSNAEYGLQVGVVIHE